MVTSKGMTDAAHWKCLQEHLQLLSCIGTACGGFADVMYAIDKDRRKHLSVRICGLDNPRLNLVSLEREIATLRQLKHENILQCHFSTVIHSYLCIGFPLMDFGSVTDVIHARFNGGLQELIIALIICDILKALNYIHSRDVVHRSVRCSHILLSSEASGKAVLSGFRYATNLMQRCRRLSVLHEFPNDSTLNLLWFAPEILQQNLTGYACNSDIYSLGISVCEMANGFPPFSDMEPMQMMLEKLKGTTPRLLDSETLSSGLVSEEAFEGENTVALQEQRQRKFSAHFHQFTELCLKTDPNSRPCASQLLTHPFFKQLKKNRQTLSELLRPLSPLRLPASKTEKVPSCISKNLEGTDSIDWDWSLT